MRVFRLQRDDDVSGVSGTGVVAQGVEFDDKTVVMRWLSDTATTTLYDSIRHVEKIHGHGGRTRVIWGTAWL